MDGQTQNSLQAQILRFEEDCAVLQNGHGELKWPMSHLPQGCKIGDSITLKIHNPETEESQRLQTMKKLLEDLIN